MPFKKGETPKGAIPFEKGESGNPAGRPVGAFSFKSIAEKILEGVITIEQAGEMRKITRKEMIVLNIINDALDDEDPNVRMKAAKMIFDHTDPLAKNQDAKNQTLVISGQLPASFTESPTFVVVGGTMDMIESEDDLPEDSDE